MARQYLMQAVSSETEQLVTWISEGSPDFAGESFPGPGDPEEIAVTGINGSDAYASGESISDIAHLGLVTEGEDSAAWTMSTGVATVQGYVGSNAPTFSAAAGDVYYRSN